MRPDHWDDWQTQFNPVGVGIDRQLIIYHRWATLDTGAVENFVIVLNFSDTPQTVTAPFPLTGQWADQLAGFDGHGGAWTVDVTGPTADIPIGSHWGRVLYQLNPTP